MKLLPPIRRVVTLDTVQRIDEAIGYDAASSVGWAISELTRFRGLVEAHGEIVIEGAPEIRVRTVDEFEKWVRARFPVMEELGPFVRKDGSRPSSSADSRFRWRELGPKPPEIRLQLHSSSENIQETPVIVDTLYASLHDEAQTVVWARDDLCTAGIKMGKHEFTWQRDSVREVELKVEARPSGAPIRATLRFRGQLPSRESAILSTTAGNAPVLDFMRLVGQAISQINGLPYRESN